MWKYEKKLQYPINITKKDPKLANLIVTQYGGPQGELGAALRYLNQRYTMPDTKGRALLTDIGTEELGHVEMICAMIYQLTEGVSKEELMKAGFDAHYVEHGLDLFPTNANGINFTTDYIAAVGDPIANLYEDMAAEQKARSTYDNILRMVKDPDVADPIRFLRAREIVHFQRFGEALRILQDELDSKNFYAYNPSFDKPVSCPVSSGGCIESN